jgi:hypothetical protein
MKFVIRMAVAFYMSLVLLLGCFLLFYVFHLIPLSDVLDFLSSIYTDSPKRMNVGIFAFCLLILNGICRSVLVRQYQRGRMLAFDNPSGRVSVSLDALEDLVKREIMCIPEVKEVRSADVFTKRNGIDRVEACVVLNAEVNIPEVIAILQERVKTKIQDSIPLEETMKVVVEVVKIVTDSAKKRSKEKDKTPPPSEPAVPFHGYRA